MLQTVPTGEIRHPQRSSKEFQFATHTEHVFNSPCKNICSSEKSEDNKLSSVSDPLNSETQHFKVPLWSFIQTHLPSEHIVCLFKVQQTCSVHFQPHDILWF